MKFIKFSWLFGALCICGLGVDAVLADTCNPGEYMVCNYDEQNGTECSDCGCASCPSGWTSDGTGVVTYCPHEYGSTGCQPIAICAGYDASVCPSSVTGKKCKTASCSPSGCEKYEVCNPTTGDIEAPVVTGDCHLEGSEHTCQPNTVPCNGHFAFDNSVSNCGDDHPTCSSLNAGNNATWNGSKWDVSACKCDTDELDITSKNCTGKYRLNPSSSNNVTTVNASIKYSCNNSKYYCTKCNNDNGANVGRCPAGIIQNSESGQCYNFDEPDSAYVACKCNQVQVDYYVVPAVFSIDYPLTENTTACPKQCPDGLGTGGTMGNISTNNDGTDVCIHPSTTVIFEDVTGKFKLSATDHCAG